MVVKWRQRGLIHENSKVLGHKQKNRFKNKSLKSARFNITVLRTFDIYTINFYKYYRGSAAQVQRTVNIFTM